MNDSGFVTRNEVQTMISPVNSQTGNINQNIANISQQINQLKQAFNEQIHMEIDSELDSTSENPVKNKVITVRINDIEAQIRPLEDNISNHSTRIGNNEQTILGIKDKIEDKFNDYDKKIAVLAGNTTVNWGQAEGNINATIIVDSELKSNSVYPVQNRVIKQALDSHSDRIGSLENSISNINTSLENIPENLSDLTNDLNLSFVTINEQTNTIVIQDVN